MLFPMKTIQKCQVCQFYVLWENSNVNMNSSFDRFSNGSVVAEFLFTLKENVPDQVNNSYNISIYTLSQSVTYFRNQS